MKSASYLYRGSFISDEVLVLFVHVWDVNVSSVMHLQTEEFLQLVIINFIYCLCSF